MKQPKSGVTVVREADEDVSQPLTGEERDRIASAFEGQSIRNKALLDEIVFILQQRLSESKIKVHDIEDRIKKIDSVLLKCERKGVKDPSLLNDIVGARVVCLFRSDMSRVAKVLESNFEVISVDDKLTDTGPLGYQSTHYICELPKRYSGPRYENSAGVKFEIQVRTLCMHAWAAVSHHLDYKGDWDVPQDLKQALSALGGLFYVADNQFEQFYSARIHSELEAAKKSNVDKGQEINLDTMKSYLKRKLSTRKHATSAAISSLVKEIKEAGYQSIKEVDNDLDRGKAAFEAYEVEHPPGPGKDGQYVDVGEVRCTLRIVSEAMRNVGLREDKNDKNDKNDKDEWAKTLLQQYEDFGHLVRSK